MFVDYYPCPFLAEIAEEVGISESAFPCKSHSAIRDGKPFGACGYGRPLVELTELIISSPVLVKKSSISNIEEAEFEDI